MSTHTPGPWYASNIGLGPESKGPYTYPLGTDPEVAAANARLIAAAPRMLEALEESETTLAGLFDYFVEDSHEWHVLKGVTMRARAAIAQAKGAK